MIIFLNAKIHGAQRVNRYVFRNSDTIIKFVDQYPMLTRKQLDYLD